jgi:glutathione peroxidase
MLMGIAVIFAAAAFVWVARSIAAESKPDEAGSTQSASLYSFAVTDIKGQPVDLSVYRGKTLLIVNTASRCGFTPQYAGLEELYQRYQSKGFEVLAFPANDFMGQEPGTNKEIGEFCSLKYHTTFPLFAKISVKGKSMHPLYGYLTTRPGYEGAIGWNFTKFLIGPDGRVIGRFGSRQEPLSDEVIRAVEAALPNAAGDR